MYEKKESYGTTHDFKEWQESVNKNIFNTLDEFTPFYIDALKGKNLYMTSPICQFEGEQYSAKVYRGTISTLQEIILREETIPYLMVRSIYPVFDADNNEIFMFRGYWKC